MYRYQEDTAKSIYEQVQITTIVIILIITDAVNVLQIET